jgi:chemotaxis protein CheX
MKQYVQPFITVCKDVFNEFLGESLDVKPPYFMDRENISQWDISAVIGLSGEARGAVVISMKDALAFKLTSILTGRAHQVLYEDVVDAAGEIINIIAGNVKYELESTFKLVISLPTIVKGKDHSINWPVTQAKIICIPFIIFDKENFSLSIALEAVKDFS